MFKYVENKLLYFEKHTIIKGGCDLVLPEHFLAMLLEVGWQCQSGIPSLWSSLTFQRLLDRLPCHFIHDAQKMKRNELVFL